MPRRRLAAVLLVPSPWAREIDGLRRACGDGSLELVPPHVTLVSPVNVAEADVPAALAALRRGAAAARGPFHLRIGPAATFAPASPVLYLSVHDDGDGDGRPGALVGVHEGVRSGPLARPPRWPWTPHVTVGQDQPDRRLRAGVEALADYRIGVSIDRLHLMEERRDDEGRRVWGPVADVVVGQPAVVGRGTFPLELSTGSMLDPECLAFLDGLGVSPPAWARAVTPPDAGAGPLVVTARRVDDGAVVGVAVAGDARTGVVRRSTGGPATGAAAWQALATGAAEEGVGEHLRARVQWLTEGA